MFKRILLVVVLCGVVAAGTIGYLYLKPTAEATAPITAIPITAVPSTGEAASPAMVVLEGEAETTSAPESAAAPVVQAAIEPAVESSVESSVQASEVSESTVFEIIPEESEARFIIDEVLNGAPKTVVGVTNQVAGQIAVNPDAAADTQVGIIQINARTLTTDSSMRNRAINNRILFTDDYEYITFAPTAITGLPENITVGQPMSFQLTGDLTVRDTTLPVTFDVEVTPASATRLVGSAGATIRYADFGISIPQVPSVTGVEDEVVLEIDFAAEPV